MQGALHVSHAVLLVLLMVSCSSPTGRALEEQIRFHRPDPLRGFKHYTGGYDIRNRHYWASAAFTGLHAYVMAGVWFIGGLIILGSLSVWRRKKKTKTISTSSIDLVPTSAIRLRRRLLPFAIILFTMLALVASVIALVAAPSFYQRAKRVERELLGAGRTTTRTGHRLVNSVSMIGELLCPYESVMCGFLDYASVQLTTESTSINNVMHKISHIADIVLGVSCGVNLGVASLTIVLAIAATVLMLQQWHSGFVRLILICWVLTSISWLLAGFNFFLHIYAEDTCSAFLEYQRQPVNSSLGSMLPCMDPVSENSLMAGIGLWIHNTIIQLNRNIVNLDYNGTHAALRIPEICDTFLSSTNSTFDLAMCPRNSVPIHEMPMILEANRLFLKEASYAMISAYTYSIQEFMQVMSDVQRFLRCSFLKEAFDDVLINHCKPAKGSILLLWSSVVSYVVIMMILELAWGTKAIQDQKKGRLSSESMPP